MEDLINDLKEQLENNNALDDSSFDYIPERLSVIRKEILKETKNKVFETKNFSQIFEVSKATYSMFENNKLGSSFRFVFKVISLFTIYGYNPIWIIAKDNLLIPKKTVSSDFVLNRSSVDSALSLLISNLRDQQDAMFLAIDEFKRKISS